MSRFLSNADLIKQRLDAHFLALGEGWEAVGTVVYRQKDIEAEADALLAKAGGAAITILWDGFLMTGKKSRIRYSLAVWCLPTADCDTPGSFADEVAEQVVLAINEWSVSGHHAHLEFSIQSGTLVPHPTYLIYDLACSVNAVIV